jgi:hypothetical protein
MDQMITGAQPKILLTQNEDGILTINEEQAKLLFDQVEIKWKLVRERDGLTKQSAGIVWLEFNENGTFKQQHEQPTIGASLVLDPQFGTYRWLTTPMLSYTEKDGVITFNTENSTYKLYSNA